VDPASQAGATTVVQSATAPEDGRAKRLLDVVPASQIAGPGEKPAYGLPLVIQIDVPEVPEHIRKPSAPMK
jgi:hypothetical protein